MSTKRKILILSANPKNTARLRLGQEVREIEEGLRRSKYRDHFTVDSRWAVSLRDLRRAMLDEEPQIVHFCGHGKEDGLMVEDEQGHAVLVPPEALAGLFKLFTHHIECVLLNACYSQAQAEAVNEYIPYVIGMSRGIQDKTAIEFALGFYDALGADKSIEEAFEFGRSAIQLSDIPEDFIPVLNKRPNDDRLEEVVQSESQETHQIKPVKYYGYVKDQHTGEPVKGATVRFNENPELQSRTTDSTGLYRFELQLEKDTLETRIQVSHQNYQEWDMYLTLTETSQVEEIQLSPKSSKKPSPPINVQIIVAIIGVLGVIGAALISNLPELFSPTVTPTPTATSTPTSMLTPTPTSTPVPPISTLTPTPSATSTPLPVSLRKRPMVVANGAEFKLKIAQINNDDFWVPQEDAYIENNFEEQGHAEKVIIDHTTGLMWQQSGSEGGLSQEKTSAYIDSLNSKNFFGHNDWRLPTIPELMSLMEPAKQKTGMYISLKFDPTQTCCWSADTHSQSEPSWWYVDFEHGYVKRQYECRVRAVRP